MAKRYAEELAALYKEHGSLDPEIVVKWARENPESALFGRFTWDDSKAAHQYRLLQARNLITEVTVVESNGKSYQTYVSPVENRHNGGYVSLAEVLSAPEKRARFLAQALSEYQRVGEKYAELTELASVREAVNRIAHKQERKKKAA
jgi:hypothetical protein